MRRSALVLVLGLALLTPPAYATDSATLVPVGDLDGDGRDDLMTSASGGVLTVHGSRTGAVLWRRTVPRVLDVRPVRLGAAGNGVVFGSYRVVSSTQGATSTYESTFVAVDRRGRDVWSHAFTWRWLRVPQDTRGPQPRVVAVGNVVGGPADDLLVALYSASFVDGSYTWSQSTVVLDGADGTAFDTGAPYAGHSELSSDSTLVGTGPVEPALVGTRVVSGSVSEQGTSVVSATRPGQVAPDWVATPDVSIYSGVVRSLGEVTGDDDNDLVLLPVNDFRPPELAVLSGSDGRVVYAGPGVAAFRSRPREVTVASVASEPRRAVLTWTALDGSGRVLRRTSTSVPSSVSVYRASVLVTSAGDVQGDGYADAVVTAMFVDGTGGRDQRHAVVDGRTGRVLWWSARAVEPFGNDVVDVDASDSGRVRVLRRDGVTGRVVWARSVRFSGHVGHSVRLASLDGDRVPDVLVTPFSSSRIGTVALAGATGRVLAVAGPIAP